MDTRKYIADHRDRIFDELFSLLRIPSISALPEHRDDMLRCADRWRELLLAAGVDRAEVMPTSASPVVFAEKVVNPDYPTVLVYAHYDVMPVEPLELWHTQPFEPVIRDGRLWGRGADDDKGQGFIQLKAFEIAVREGLLRCNVKFLIEGGEEIGSPGVEEFCKTHLDLLRCDVILVSDTSMVGLDTPSITTGLRGLAYWEIEVTGPNRDLHSGIFGGTVANPINELCKMLAGVVDGNGRIVIPHFYDDVENVSAEERAMLGAVPYDEVKYKQAIEVDELSGETGFSPLERTAIRPTFDICGIWGGYTGEGAKTVLPSKAYAKVSCRLVPHQNHEKISQMFIDYIESVAPRSVKVKVTPMHGGESYVCPIDLPAYKAAEQGYALAFGKQPLAVRRGGSIPIIATFEKVLGVKSVLMGFGLESDATHSPNENFLMEMYEKGIVAVVEFYNRFGH
ncbi:MAG TPA: dipeptidase [Candidatus Barnesiella excrementavium]|nr:dipeptidase [Candidatus Barnesiella excrementavium]